MTPEQPSPPPSPETSPPSGESDRARFRAYWRVNLAIVGALLAVWAGASLGLGVLLVDQLNRFKIGGAPLGFWVAQQGAIYVFVVLILIYVVAMARLDRRFGVREE